MGISEIFFLKCLCFFKVDVTIQVNINVKTFLFFLVKDSEVKITNMIFYLLFILLWSKMSVISQ